VEISLGLSEISNFGVDNDTGYQGVIEDGFTRGHVDLGIGAQDFYSYCGDLTFIWTF
jgi:hypothetical protein